MTSRIYENDCPLQVISRNTSFFPSGLRTPQTQKLCLNVCASSQHRAWNIVLAWPKSLFGFFCVLLGKTQMNFLANPINTHWMGCYPGYGSMTKIILLKGKKKLLSSILESSVCNKKKNLAFMLLLLSRFSRVRLCVTPWTAAYQAPPSLGFSRQEHWSGLPFPSPMHESGKWKWSRLVVSDS